MICEESNSEHYQLSGKKVLITGATGFIGQHLCKRLMNMGALVHGTSRNSIDNNGTSSGIHWWQGSFEDLETSRTILKKVRPDYIFHLAGDVTAANDLKHTIQPTTAS